MSDTFYTVASGLIAVPPQQVVSGVANCNPGDKVIGGGVMTGEWDMNIVCSAPNDPNSGLGGMTQWYAQVYNGSTAGSRDFQVFAICVHQA